MRFRDSENAGTENTESRLQYIRSIFYIFKNTHGVYNYCSKTCFAVTGCWISGTHGCNSIQPFRYEYDNVMVLQT